jgi:hypothetical protein
MEVLRNRFCAVLLDLAMLGFLFLSAMNQT